METRRRALVKALFWNALGLVTMSLVGLAMTGSVAVGSTIAVANTLIGLTVYIAYERIWARVRWGLKDV